MTHGCVNGTFQFLAEFGVALFDILRRLNGLLYNSDGFDVELCQPCRVDALFAQRASEFTARNPAVNTLSVVNVPAMGHLKVLKQRFEADAAFTACFHGFVRHLTGDK